MTDEPTVGPEPTEILSKAAAVENMVTWLIAWTLCKDEQTVRWFMQFAADRIPVDEKTRLLGKIIETLPDPSLVPPGVLDDLRAINRVRVRVAHSLFIDSALTDGAPARYVMQKKGVASTVSEQDLRAQVADALTSSANVLRAFVAIADQTGLFDVHQPEPRSSDPGTGED